MQDGEYESYQNPMPDFVSRYPQRSKRTMISSILGPLNTISLAVQSSLDRGESLWFDKLIKNYANLLDQVDSKVRHFVLTSIAEAKLGS